MGDQDEPDIDLRVTLFDVLNVYSEAPLVTQVWRIQYVKTPFIIWNNIVWEGYSGHSLEWYLRINTHPTQTQGGTERLKKKKKKKKKKIEL